MVIVAPTERTMPAMCLSGKCNLEPLRRRRVGQPPRSARVPQDRLRGADQKPLPARGPAANLGVCPTRPSVESFTGPKPRSNTLLFRSLQFDSFR